MSQFADIFKAIRNDDIQAETEKEQPKIRKRQSSKIEATAKIAAPNDSITAANAPPQIVVAKRTGKSSDPEFTQVLTYIKKATHKDVRRALLDDDGAGDFSDLVENLLSNWLSNKN